MTLKAKLESILFISNRPLSLKKLAELTNGEVADVETALKELEEQYNSKEGGVILLRAGKECQFSTSPDASKLVRNFVREELTGELTKPQLETLTVIAYRGPISKPELEQIRGVNCSLILRNLMIRGLVEESEERGEIRFNITMDFLRHLGLRNVSELPDYEKLNSNESLQKFLNTRSDKHDPNNPNTFE